MNLFNRLKFLLPVFLFTFSVQAQTLKDALRLTDNEQYDVAGATFQSLIQKEPANGTYWFYCGENFWKWENPDSAKICYQKGLQVEPANALNLVGLGKTFLEQGNLIEAKSNFDKALLTAQTKLTLVQMKIAEAYITSAKHKDLEYAMVLLQKAATAEPKNSEIFILIGDVFTVRNDGTSAAENYNKALDLDKNLAKAVVRKGILYKRSLNYEIAKEEFENAIKIDSMFAPAHRELGEVFFRLRKLEQAKAEYRKYLELSKNTSDARLRYASFLFLSKDYSGTLSELNQLSKLNPENNSMLRLSAYTYYEVEDSANALQYINKVFEKNVESKRTQTDYEYYAKILAKNGQDSLSAITFQKAYSLDSSKTELLIDLGMLYMKMKKYNDAANVFQNRVDYGKGVNSTDYFNLGKAHSSAKNYEKADSALAKVNEMLPTWSYGFLIRARTVYNLDSLVEAGLSKPHYEKYVELVLPDTANFSKNKDAVIEAYRYLGNYYFNKKQNAEVKEYMKKILLIIPNDKQANDVLDGLNQPKKEK